MLEIYGYMSPDTFRHKLPQTCNYGPTRIYHRHTLMTQYGTLNERSGVIHTHEQGIRLVLVEKRCADKSGADVGDAYIDMLLVRKLVQRIEKHLLKSFDEL